MSAWTPADEPDFDNMTDDEIIALFDEMQAIEDHKWGMVCEECEEPCEHPETCDCSVAHVCGSCFACEC